MQGHAFKCDGCGRVTFAADTRDTTPPEGWFALSQSGPNGIWPVWHFESIECLSEFAAGLLGPLRGVPEEEPSGEVVISEWEGREELGPMPGLQTIPSWTSDQQEG